MSGTVHVVGAGLAGLSAAASLAEAGQRVVLHEAAKQAGGRCRSYFDPSLGLTIDNGNHLLLSGNRSSLDFMRLIGAPDDALTGPEEAAFEAKAEAFQQAMGAMQGEMQTALTAAGPDQAKANADMDAIAARYQPQADAFATELDAFITSQLSVMPPEAQAQMAQMGPMLRGQITTAPATIKAGLLQAAATAAVPAAPQ